MEASGRRDRLHQFDQIGDALLAIAEHVGQFPGHGDGVERGRGASGSAASTAASNLPRSQADGQGIWATRATNPIFDACDFHIGAAQIPADHVCHGPSLRQTGGLFKPGKGTEAYAGLRRHSSDRSQGRPCRPCPRRRARRIPADRDASSASADDPIAIARALLAITASPALYVADLDAIERRRQSFRSLPGSCRCPSGHDSGSMPASPTSRIAPSGSRSELRW